jgi:hypothetical protein
MNGAGNDESEKTVPIFRTDLPKKKQLTTNPMTDNDMQRMFKRRILAAGLPGTLSPHSFRVTTITTLLEQGVALEDVQNLPPTHGPLGFTIGGSERLFGTLWRGFRFMRRSMIRSDRPK